MQKVISQDIHSGEKVGRWMLDVRSWKLEARGWRLEVRFQRLETTNHKPFALRSFSAEVNNK